MSESDFLERRKKDWLDWVEKTLQEGNRPPDKMAQLRQQAESIAKRKLQEDLQQLKQFEERGISKPIAEELVVIHARLNGLRDTLMNIDRILELKQKQKQKEA